jgi:hypothetical protein
METPPCTVRAEEADRRDVRNAQNEGARGDHGEIRVIDTVLMRA